MTKAENLRLEVLWAAQDKVFRQCAEADKCVCGEQFTNHDFNGCLQWIRQVKSEFLQRCATLGVEVP